MGKKTKFTVGDLAKQANVSVRTIQYYDKIGLLKPASTSTGGRRLYSENDIAVLHQIITLKSFGLSLDEIKTRIMPIHNSKDVVIALESQSLIISEQISKAQKVLESIEMLKRDIIESKTVDWSKYTKMMDLVHDNNENYWVTHFLDEETIAKISDKYDKSDQSIIRLKQYLERANALLEQGIGHKSVEGQALAKEMWQLVQKYSEGHDETILRLYDFFRKGERWPKAFGSVHKKTRRYIEKAVFAYLVSNGIAIPGGDMKGTNK